MADNKKNEAAPEDDGAKKKKKLIIIGGAALLLLIVAGVASYFLFLKKDDSAEEKPKDQAAATTPAPELTPPPAIGPMIEIKEFVVNIVSESDRHYVKASLTIELINNTNIVNKETKATGNDAAKEEATQRMPQIRDSILLLISNKTYEELQDLQGKKQLKAELASKINSVLQSGKVKEIYFTDFVVQ